MSLLSRRTVLALVALAIGPASVNAVAAERRGSRDEARALADAAFQHIRQVGPGQAYRDFTTDKATWTNKDLYVMVYDRRNVALAHGANASLVGRDMSAVKDAEGRSVVGSLNALASQGGGWFDYGWPDPLTNTLMLKSTYARLTPDGQGFIGVGVFR